MSSFRDWMHCRQCPSNGTSVPCSRLLLTWRMIPNDLNLSPKVIRPCVGAGDVEKGGSSALPLPEGARMKALLALAVSAFQPLHSNLGLAQSPVRWPDVMDACSDWFDEMAGQ